MRQCKQLELEWWRAYYKFFRNKVFYISTIQGIFAWWVYYYVKPFFRNEH